MHQHAFTFYVIPSHWHDTGSWNRSSHKTRTYLFYIVNITGTDVLGAQGARASTTIIFTMLSQIDLVPAYQGLTIQKLIRLTTVNLSKLRITGHLCYESMGRFPTQKDSRVENVSMPWRNPVWKVKSPDLVSGTGLITNGIQIVDVICL